VLGAESVEIPLQSVIKTFMGHGQNCVQHGKICQVKQMPMNKSGIRDWYPYNAEPKHSTSHDKCQQAVGSSTAKHKTMMHSHEKNSSLGMLIDHQWNQQISLRKNCFEFILLT